MEVSASAVDAVSKLVQKVGFENYVADGNEAVVFKLIRNVSDLQNEDLEFHPEMCHQIFGDGETIFGYENLEIQLYFAAGSLKPFIGIKYSRKISAAICDGVEPDNVIQQLKAVIPPSFTTNLDDFCAHIDKEALSFRPPGELIHSFQKSWTPRVSSSNKPSPKKNQPSSNGHSKDDKTYEIYVCDGSVPKFLEYHHRMESFILWFIDAASMLEATDTRWKFHLMFEKYKTSDGNKCYAFIGYASIYEFYHYPDKIRPRVAQMLILPPFQKQGLGVELLSTIYNRYRNDNKAIEITVEDPSDDFEVLRDFVDSRDCLDLESFSPEKLKTGFTPEMEAEAKATLKMTKRQVKRIYEILRLRSINVNDEVEFKKFRLAVKQRLNIPYNKQNSDIKRMMRRNYNPTELQKVVQVDDATRHTELESNFQNLLSHYKMILRRLASFGYSP